MRSISGWLAHELGPIVLRWSGVDQTPRGAINFIGGTVADNEADGSIDVTLGAGSTPTGTGIPHVVSGSQNAAASLIVNADVHASAAIAGSKLVAATTSDPGSMSAADKTKLNGIQKQGAAVAIYALDIDWSLGQVFTKTLAGGGSTFTFSNAASGMTIIVRLTGATSTVTWPTVKWAAGTPPTQTSAGTDVYTFVHDGTSIYGSVVQAMA